GFWDSGMLHLVHKRGTYLLAFVYLPDMVADQRSSCAKKHTDIPGPLLDINQPRHSAGRLITWKKRYARFLSANAATTRCLVEGTEVHHGSPHELRLASR